MNGAKPARSGLLLIGALKLLKSLALFVVSVGMLSLLHRDAAEAVRQWVEFFRLDVHARLIERLLAKVAGIDHQTMRRLSVGTLLYATVFAIEGVGLLMAKTWAEYLTTGVTISFLPIELYEFVEHPSATKAIVTLINVAVVAYLVREIRGRRAIEQLRAETQSSPSSD